MPDDASITGPPERDSAAAGGVVVPLPPRMAVLGAWLAGHPLASPALGLIAGILLDAWWPVPVGLAIAVFAAAAAVVVAARDRDDVRHVGLMLAALALGAVRHDLALRRWPADHMVTYCSRDATPVRLTGTLLAPPAVRPVRSGRIQWFRQLPRSRLLVEADHLEGVTGAIPVSGTALVHVREPVLHVNAGDRVELFGTMYRPKPPANPGGRDWALIRRRDGVLVEMSCEHAANVVACPGSGTKSWITRARQRARAAMLDRTMPGDVPGSQLLAALVLGQRSAVDPALNKAFVDTGTVHYLSVSGAHVGMLASAIWLGAFCVGMSRRTAAGAALVAITAYAVLAEPRPAILRAAVMADLFCIAILLRRPVRTANWLAAAAIILLLFQPTQLFNAGFQLSFLTLLAIMYVSPRIHEAGGRALRRMLGRSDPLMARGVQDQLSPPGQVRLAGRAVGHVLGWYLSIGLAAWMVGSLVGAYHFGQVAVWGWLNTLLILPLVWCTLVLGLAKTVLTLAVPAAGAVLGLPLAAVTQALIATVSALARLPGAGLPVPAMPAWLTLAGLAVLALWALTPWLRVRGRWVIAAALGFAVVSAVRLAPLRASDALQMHVLAVGDGTACVITLPDGATMIYDIGAVPPYDLERWTIGPLLARQRVYRIDRVAISHANLDHYSGLPDLAARRRVSAIIVSPHFRRIAADDRSASRLLDDLAPRGIPWREVVRGDRIDAGAGVTIDVLWPPPPEELLITRPNDTSIVLRIGYAGKRVLLCGDVQEFGQERLLATADLRADVLVLPHHGGVARDTQAFVDAVDPDYCVRSSGQPDAQTTNGLLEIMAGRRYFNTADDGAIEITLTPAELRVRPWRDRDDR